MQKQAWLWIAAGAGTGPTIVDTLSRRSCDSVSVAAFLTRCGRGTGWRRG